MTSTPDWMRRGQDLKRPSRPGLPLGGIVAWALVMVIAISLILVMGRLVG
jgi:cell division protein FtsX